MADSNLIVEWAGFEWDEGNLLKNWEKHGVTAGECEQVFFNRPLIAGHDEKHSQKETRFFALGHTDSGRLLFVVFTIRNHLIRVISARNMNRKERKVYDKS
ncbi:MAG: BrnT family toxin [Thermodesulfobacteriota bacterium]|nr:BrnT family toxin [Thermodesulfobacteriota bacterium]